MDLEARARWVDYSKAKDEMFAYTDTKEAPWYVVEADDKRRRGSTDRPPARRRFPYEARPTTRRFKLPPTARSRAGYREPGLPLEHAKDVRPRARYLRASRLAPAVLHARAAAGSRRALVRLTSTSVPVVSRSQIHAAAVAGDARSAGRNARSRRGPGARTPTRSTPRLEQLDDVVVDIAERYPEFIAEVAGRGSARRPGRALRAQRCAEDGCSLEPGVASSFRPPSKVGKS